MRKLIIFCFVILMFSTIVFADEVTVTRDLSSFNISEAFEVILEITVSGNLVAVGIEEYAPVGAQIINCSAENFRIENNKVEILLFNSGNPIQSQNISYFILLNSSNSNFTENHSVVLIEESENNQIAQSSTSSGSSSSGGGTSGRETVSNNITENSTTAFLEDSYNFSENSEEKNNSEKGVNKNSAKILSKKLFDKKNLFYVGAIFFISGFLFVKRLKRK